MLVDDIYEAAVLPERWGAVLDRLSREFRARGGMLIRATPTSQRSICSPAIEATVRLFEQTDLVGQNVRVERLVAHPPHPGFLTDLDLVTLDEIETLPIYTRWLTPHDCTVGAATLIHDSPSNALLLSLEGLPGHDEARHSIPALDALRPHIARSAMLSARFHFERMRSAMEALGTVGMASAVVDGRGHIQMANAGFEAEMTGFVGTRGLLRLPPAAQAQFDVGLAQLQGPGASLGIRLADGGFRVLHMVPVRGDARDIFTNVAAFLILVDPARRSTPGTGLLQSLFDLSPAEARIADALVAGRTLKEIATATGISLETVRAHLKSIFAKTGINRQIDLVAMLGAMARPEQDVPMS
ncbi:MAG: helix-turn-helix transcriptional regulator [Sphingobium sp.]